MQERCSNIPVKHRGHIDDVRCTMIPPVTRPTRRSVRCCTDSSVLWSHGGHVTLALLHVLQGPPSSWPSPCQPPRPLGAHRDLWAPSRFAPFTWKEEEKKQLKKNVFIPLITRYILRIYYVMVFLSVYESSYSTTVIIVCWFMVDSAIFQLYQSRS